MSKKIKQHYIPRVYLKWFQIDNDQNKNFVYCVDFSDKYNTKTRRKGINDKVFTQKKFYNDNRLNNPFAIEDVLGSYFEPQYDEIIKAISNESKISTKTVEDLITWMYISKMRSPHIRASTEGLLDFIISATNAQQKQIPTELEKKNMDENIKRTAQQVHLNLFSDSQQTQNLLDHYFNTLSTKHWRILKSMPEFPFWTNDNPGFSPNINPVFAKETPFHKVIELNSSSIIFYVLTPKYCLQITPFVAGTSPDLCALNMDIEFSQASPNLIDYINKGVFYSRYKLIISNSKELLDNCIQSQTEK